MEGIACFDFSSITVSEGAKRRLEFIFLPLLLVV
jgi:hypothetical protein